jgi:hypothetical protein
VKLVEVVEVGVIVIMMSGCLGRELPGLRTVHLSVVCYIVYSFHTIAEHAKPTLAQGRAVWVGGVLGQQQK